MFLCLVRANDKLENDGKMSEDELIAQMWYVILPMMLSLKMGRKPPRI